MVFLDIKVTFENIQELWTNHPNYTFWLKLKCTSCGEISPKWHDVTESETFQGKNEKSETHFIAKCKLCSRENCLGIKEKSNGKYTLDDQGNFKPLVEFTSRGLEPVEFKAGPGWIAKAENSGKIFEDIDLEEKEWADYDDKANQSVGIYELEYRFRK